MPQNSKLHPRRSPGRELDAEDLSKPSMRLITECENPATLAGLALAPNEGILKGVKMPKISAAFIAAIQETNERLRGFNESLEKQLCAYVSENNELTRLNNVLSERIEVLERALRVYKELEAYSVRVPEKALEAAVVGGMKVSASVNGKAARGVRSDRTKKINEKIVSLYSSNTWDSKKHAASKIYDEVAKYAKSIGAIGRDIPSESRIAQRLSDLTKKKK